MQLKFEQRLTHGGRKKYININNKYINTATISVFLRKRCYQLGIFFVYISSLFRNMVYPKTFFPPLFKKLIFK